MSGDLQPVYFDSPTGRKIRRAIRALKAVPVPIDLYDHWLKLSPLARRIVMDGVPSVTGRSLGARRPLRKKG